MFRFEHLILCASLLLVCEHAVAQGPPKSGKRYDEALHSYVFEPSDDFSDFQADATTAYPPLVENETNTVSFCVHKISFTLKVVLQKRFFFQQLSLIWTSNETI